MKREVLLLFFLLFSSLIWGQKEVSGVVKDEQGIPLAGVNVVAKGSSVGMSTDFDGKFTIKVPEKISVLVFSSVGMKTQERKIQKEKFLSVVMQEDLTEIEEIVVTGYQQVSPEKVLRNKS